MPMKKYKPEQIVTLLRQIEVEIANGKTTPQACRDAQITAQTFYCWRKEFGGLKLDQAKRLKELEKENAKLKRLVAELSQEKTDSGGCSGGKLLSPERRRGAVEHARRKYKVSEWQACRMLKQRRGTQRYVPMIRADEEALTKAIIALASEYGRNGCRKITAKLQGPAGKWARTGCSESGVARG
jgi:putative transposase